MSSLLMLVPLLVVGGSSGYTRVGGASAVEVYRDMASPVIALAAEGDIDAPPSVVRAIVLDYGNAHALSEHITESRVLGGNGNETHVYQRLSLPVISDRDYTLRALWGERNGTLWTRFNVDNSRGPEERDEIVRLSTLSGGWDLSPIRGGQATHAVYRMQIDLAGSIPRWMVSGGAAKDLPKLFDGVRKQARDRLMVHASN